MSFTIKIKVSDLKGIINSYCLVAIREFGSKGKRQNYRITFKEALAKFGEYTVYFIDPLDEDLLGLVVSENDT